MAVSPAAYRHSMPGELGEVLLVRAYRGVRVHLLFKLGELLPHGPLAQLGDNVDTASEPPGHLEQRTEQVWLAEQVAGEEHLLPGRPDELEGCLLDGGARSLAGEDVAVILTDAGVRRLEAGLLPG